MARHALGGTPQARVAGCHADVAALLIARALAEVYRDLLNEPVPERLAAILRRAEKAESPHGPDPA